MHDASPALPLCATAVSILSAGPVPAEVIDLACAFDFACVKLGECGRSDFSMDFVLDTTSGDAFARGNGGLNPVMFHQGYASVTFIERLDSGAVQTTTIADGGIAVHSRNTVIGGTISNSQHLGRCRKE